VAVSSGNILGSVIVTITGDTSQLQASLQQAQQMAATAGQRIAAAYNTGIAPAANLTAETDRVIVAIGRLAGIIQQESAAASLAAQRNLALGNSLQQFGQGAGQAHNSLRFLIFGLKDLTEGRFNYAMAEGVNVLQRYAPAFVGVGIAAIAAFAIITHGSEEAKKAQEELLKATEAADRGFANMERTLDQLNVQHVRDVFGGAAGKGAEATVLEQQAARIRGQMDDLRDSIQFIARAGAGSIENYIPILSIFHDKAVADNMKAVVQQIRELKAELGTNQGEQDAARREQRRQAAQEAGQITVAEIGQEKQAREAAFTLQKTFIAESLAADHNAEQVRIAFIQDRQIATVEAAREELRLEQEKQRALTATLAAELPKRQDEIRRIGAAESQGKSAPEAKRIGIDTQTKLNQAQSDADEKTLAASAAVAEAKGKVALAEADYERELAARISKDWISSFEEVKRRNQERFIQQNLPGAVDVLSGQKVGEIRAQSAGEVEALRIAGQRAQIEVSYGLQKTHTLAQEIAYRQQLIGLQEQEFSAKRRGLEAELQSARDDEAAVHGTEKQIEASARVAEIEGRIARLVQEQANARSAAAAQTGRASLGAQIGGDLRSAGAAVPAALGNAIAKGVFQGGKGIGADIKNSLKGIGQELLGKVIDQLIVSLAANTIATNLNTIVTGIKAIFGFADGGRPPVGVPSIVGEKGPELFVPDNSGTIIPAGKFGAFGGGSYSASSSVGSIAIHLHGNQNGSDVVDHVIRNLPGRLKQRNAQFATYNQ